jgi:hypothetical protein
MSKHNVPHLVTPTITGAYANGDTVGGRLDLTPPGGIDGELREIRLVDDSNNGAALYLYLFDGQPSSIADNVAFDGASFLIADHDKLIARISIAAADYITINSNKSAIKEDINKSIATGQLWGYIVTNASTPTYSAGDLHLRLLFWKPD